MASTTTTSPLRREAEDRVRLRREELKKLCVVQDVKNHVSLDKYFQRAHVMYRQCQLYAIQHDYDHAYIYLWLMVLLFQYRIPQHREYHQAKYAAEKARLNDKCKQAMQLLDQILDGMLREELDQLQQHHEDEYFILQHGEDNEEVQAAASSVSYPTSSSAAAKDPAGLSLEARLQALRMLAPQTPPPQPKPTSARLDSHARAKAMDALKMPSRATLPPPEMTPSTRYPSTSSTVAARAKPASDSMSSRRQSLENRTLSLQNEVRELSIPANLIQDFIRIADPNTRKPPYGIETCGILTGTLTGCKLAISTLIIPKQTGSSDMCTMTHEEELFEYCIANDLLTLGWIHTHPSQTCFLSSVDIHTQCGFQSMLAEAIAIVVAPRDAQKSIGVFRLTSPHGMELIQNCSLSGFHEHPSNLEIYSDALQIVWSHAAHARVVDMRY
ncbi:hypothetical protein SPRG_12561 [Saprolegnia parasitica CBS 223.65]|uniref:MPN domain-containing protein n=1 Tax=Saprolegnia parasitica (strain CBS 223.65) TaxID=695850 RepID=A0A067C7Q3_SAPPC|nr:hypothetical protein SPRG_12561 [Saprolegnia parasitica CBS 223.65]KDO22581.1 hypothetical protein SPRG_12561 [Saprolegnia parasitica CBS 223.65]|eukprot:XP_012206697.1 hypothetical protein SPRG_12561 [Saprolegnia parasitica CBS 223.65]